MCVYECVPVCVCPCVCVCLLYFPCQCVWMSHTRVPKKCAEFCAKLHTFFFFLYSSKQLSMGPTVQYISPTDTCETIRTQRAQQVNIHHFTTSATTQVWSCSVNDLTVSFGSNSCSLSKLHHLLPSISRLPSCILCASLPYSLPLVRDIKCCSQFSLFSNLATQQHIHLSGSVYLQAVYSIYFSTYS